MQETGNRSHPHPGLAVEPTLNPSTPSHSGPARQGSSRLGNPDWLLCRYGGNPKKHDKMNPNGNRHDRGSTFQRLQLPRLPPPLPKPISLLSPGTLGGGPS